MTSSDGRHTSNEKIAPLRSPCHHRGHIFAARLPDCERKLVVIVIAQMVVPFQVLFGSGSAADRNLSSAELESGNARRAFLQTPAPVPDKIPGPQGAQFVSSTGLGFWQPHRKSTTSLITSTGLNLVSQSTSRSCVPQAYRMSLAMHGLQWVCGR